MNKKLLLRIAASVGAFVLVSGISIAALARSGAGSSTVPRLPVVSTPEMENDATETPDPEETHSPALTHTETPEADHEAENENDDSEDSDDQGEDADDQGENDDDQGEDADDHGENEDGDD